MSMELLGQHIQAGMLDAALRLPLGGAAVKCLYAVFYGGKEATQSCRKMMLESTFPAVGEMLRNGPEKLLVKVTGA